MFVFRQGNPMSSPRQAPDFLVHAASDSVGVIVVEGVDAGRQLTGWIMETDTSITMQARAPIPIGHKIALVDITASDTILKYGHGIGRSLTNIRPGDHVHVHNLKTSRW